MMLLTKELEHRFARLGMQKGDDAIVVAKFFTPDGSWTWFATEFDHETRKFFGLVEGRKTELGYFRLEELETTTGPYGLHIERDLWWKEQTLRQVRESLATGRSL